MSLNIIHMRERDEMDGSVTKRSALVVLAFSHRRHSVFFRSAHSQKKFCLSCSFSCSLPGLHLPPLPTMRGVALLAAAAGVASLAVTVCALENGVGLLPPSVNTSRLCSRQRPAHALNRGWIAACVDMLYVCVQYGLQYSIRFGLLGADE